MKQNSTFAKNFLSICVGITIVMCSLSLFMFSIQSAHAESPSISTPVFSMPQVGTAENYITPSIHDGYAYWVIYNTTDGYKFRKSPVSGGHWVQKD